MASLILTFADLYTRVSNFLGMTGPTVAPTSTNLTVCKDIVYRGYRQFLYPVDSRTGETHDWSFLKQLHVFKTKSGQYKYSLPADFSDFITNPQYDDDGDYEELIKISPKQIQEIRSATTSGGYPVYFAIAPYTYDNDIGTMYELWLDPEPDGQYIMKFFYRIDPLKPENATDYVVGGVRASEAILQNCLAIAEQQEKDIVGMHTQLANELTQKLIRNDIQEDSDFLGNLGDKIRTPYKWPSAFGISEVYEDEGGVG